MNSDLVGKVINIASRCAGFLVKGFDGKLADTLHDPELWQQFTAKADEIASLYEVDDTSKAVREITALADLANQYIASHEPWNLNKDPDRREYNWSAPRQSTYPRTAIYLKPILPQMAEKSEAFPQVPPLSRMFSSRCWGIPSRSAPCCSAWRQNYRCAGAGVLRRRASAQEIAEATAEANDAEPKHINIDDFAKVELKVAKIIAADFVEGADKLLQLTLDVGDHQRQVFSGIREAYDPADVVGRLTVVVANLALRKMRFRLVWCWLPSAVAISAFTDSGADSNGREVTTTMGELALLLIGAPSWSSLSLVSFLEALQGHNPG